MHFLTPASVLADSINARSNCTLYFSLLHPPWLTNDSVQRSDCSDPFVATPVVFFTPNKRSIKKKLHWHPLLWTVRDIHRNNECICYVSQTHLSVTSRQHHYLKVRSHRIRHCTCRKVRTAQNLSWWCVSTLWTPLANKISRFQKFNMAAAAILKIRKTAISSQRIYRFWLNLALWYVSVL